MNFFDNMTDNMADGFMAVLFILTLPLLIPFWLIGIGLKKLGFRSSWGQRSVR